MLHPRLVHRLRTGAICGDPSRKKSLRPQLC
jgi:hypothetical protein